MGASSSRAGGGQHRGGGLVRKEEAPRHHRRRQEPPRPQPKRCSAATAQAPHRRSVVPASETHAQGSVNQNASSNSDNPQGVDGRQTCSVKDGRNSNEEGTEASQVTRAIKPESSACDADDADGNDDGSEPNVTCGLEAAPARVEPKGSNAAVPVIVEEDDECAICLEGYSEESPKLLIQCEHHYHLHCMIDWTQRNHTCPICGRVADFDGTPLLQGY